MGIYAAEKKLNRTEWSKERVTEVDRQHAIIPCILNIDSHYPLMFNVVDPIFGPCSFISNDCTRKGKPVARQRRKAIESPTGDGQAAERHRRGNGSRSPICLPPSLGAVGLFACNQ